MGGCCDKADVKNSQYHDPFATSANGATGNNQPPMFAPNPLTSNNNSNNQGSYLPPRLPGAGGPLNDIEINSRVTCSKQTESVDIVGYHLRYAYYSQRGYYPEALSKPNQDAFCVQTNFGGHKNMAFFSVFDGHGSMGDVCAQFARDQLPKLLSDKLPATFNELQLKNYIIDAHVETNRKMHEAPFDDSMSGTTAISLLVVDEMIYVSNVGDSRAIIGQLEDKKYGGSPHTVAKPLSVDQTPFRKDERDRVKKTGARVLTVDQLEGFEPIHENWGVNLGDEIDETGDPPRIWHPVGDYPGTAFTRSIGDSISEELGVIAVPEILSKKLNNNDKFIVIASDGVFEFLTSQSVADIVKQYDDPLKACKAVVTEAYNLWLQYEVRTDDITMICIFLEGVTEERDQRGSIFTGAELLEFQASMKPVRRAGERTGGRKRDTIVGSDAIRITLVGDIGDEMEIGNNVLTGYDVDEHRITKSNEEVMRIADSIKSNFLFQHLNVKQREDVFSVMYRKEVVAGEVVIQQGDHGEEFFVVDIGDFEVRIKQDGAESNADPNSLEGKYGPVVHEYSSNGGVQHPSFGELALMHSKPRAATVIAKTRGILWALDRLAFRNILMHRPMMIRNMVQVLRKVDVLKPLKTTQLQRLAEVLKAVTFKKGDKIIKAGDIGDTFYIIVQGDVKVESGSGPPVSLGAHEYFGERGLLTGEPRMADVVASSEEVKCLHIHRDDFEKYLGPLRYLIDLDAKRRQLGKDFEQMKKSWKNGDFVPAPNSLTTNRTINKEEWNFGIKDIEVIAEVWNDGDSHVLRLVRNKVTRKEYTLKSANKRAVVSEGLQAQVAGERDVYATLTGGTHALAPLLSTLDDETSLHMLLQRVIVADLSTFLDQTPQIERVAQYYAAEVVLALNYLHEVGYVYRALSPEMLTMDKDGHICLTNIRLAKYVGTGRTYTLCGTAEYLAPEQVKGHGHGQASDLWALGIFIYELLAGNTPFYNETYDEMEIYKRIASFAPGGLNIPEGVSPYARDIMNGLINPRPAGRLGFRNSMIPGGQDDPGRQLQTHAFFSSIDWDKLRTGLVEAPLAEAAKTKYAELTASTPTEDALLDVGEPFKGDDTWFKDF